jgi:cyclopropane-fatty-acyl-phospholipid synthase
MTYSWAIFEDPELTLREAQESKLDRVCRKLELGPEDHVLEIGTAGARSRCTPPSATAAA